ncbi:hypothetical protein PHMEG_0008439 [Phytophthora megakarya]|uniref:DDE Tnp4 domain-containing protein n=1 Tax=Phytophthora megakarya TaxID=4795 RepID=A0A225WJ63_9STRA|nr:hypothetical protein PHMEG_0008439 [Phytophthora megakarya]
MPLMLPSSTLHAPWVASWRLKYYSGKHHLYGHKVEVSVLLTGVAIQFTPWVPGGESDINIYKETEKFHRSAVQKLEGEGDPNGEGPSKDRFENDWAILVDKGLKDLWGVCSPKWVWDRKFYDMFFRVCVALTNFNIRCNPWRRQDSTLG